MIDRILEPVERRRWITDGMGKAEELIQANRRMTDPEICSSLEAQGYNSVDASEAVSLARENLVPAERDLMCEYSCYTYKSLRELRVDPSLYIAGDGWIRRGGCTLITGSTGIGKSVFAEQCGIAVATGNPIMGIPVHRPCRVLVVEAENDEDILKRDFLGIVKQGDTAIDLDLLDRNLRVVNVFGEHGQEFAKTLSRLVAQFHPEMIVIDPLQSFVPPSDTNGSQSYMSFSSAIDRIIKVEKCALLMTCHTGKPTRSNKREGLDAVYMAVGHSVLPNWVRSSCEIIPGGKKDRRFRLNFGKNAERTSLRNEAGEAIRSLFIEHSDNPDEPCWRIAGQQEAQSGGKKDPEIRAYREAYPHASQSEIAKVVGCNKSTVSRCLSK